MPNVWTNNIYSASNYNGWSGIMITNTENFLLYYSVLQWYFTCISTGYNNLSDLMGFRNIE